MTPGKSYKIPPPFETARAQSELLTFQCSQWVPIQNSQLIGRYKEMSVWHQVNLTKYPPSISDREQCDVFTVQCCHWHSKTDIYVQNHYFESKW